MRSPSSARQRRQHVGGRPRLGVHVAGPRLAGQRPHPLAQDRRGVGVDAGVVGHVDHAVVGGDVQDRPGRQPVGELLGEAVDDGELLAPGLGVDARGRGR
jgi:hypothetical protein